MSENLSQKDKIILDTTDSDEMTDHFSRLSPGDEVSGTFKATLDEAGQKMVTLSIVEITVKDAAPVTMNVAEGGEDEPASVTILKNEHGTPEQEGAENVPEPLLR